jgi:hypothetical protein
VSGIYCGIFIFEQGEENMKNLYEVETELIIYVMAENESEAVIVAQRNIRDETDNLLEHQFSACRPTHYRVNWENGTPYGSDTNQTVKEIMEAEKEAAKKQAEREFWEKKQLKMFEGREWCL